MTIKPKSTRSPGGRRCHTLCSTSGSSYRILASLVHRATAFFLRMLPPSCLLSKSCEFHLLNLPALLPLLIANWSRLLFSLATASLPIPWSQPGPTPICSLHCHQRELWKHKSVHIMLWLKTQQQFLFLCRWDRNSSPWHRRHGWSGTSSLLACQALPPSRRSLSLADLFLLLGLALVSLDLGPMADVSTA